MAVVLDTLGSYIQDLLKKLVKEEVQMLLGVHGEIKQMDIRLKDLKLFLADAERRKVTDQRVQAWVRELRNVMYEITNILDLCQLKSMEQGPRRDVGWFNPLLFCLRDPLHAHEIGRRIKKLNKSLEQIKKRSMEFGFINLSSYENRSRRASSSRCADNRETSSELETSSLVGEKIEDDTINLVEMLTKEEKNIEGKKLMIFSIVGVGGIGKTTLAKNIFNHNIIQKEFSKKMWLSVNQHFSDTELLRRAIIEAGRDHQSAGSTRGSLERELKEALYGHKTFLVLDDVWSVRPWEDVLKTPLVNALGHGSRILITTRHDMVARGVMAEEPYHHVVKLNPEDAWSLVKKQVVRNEKDETQVGMLKDIGMVIVQEHCDCLPLAVKVMGGLLRQKKVTRDNWEKVLHGSARSTYEMPEDISSALYLSYDDLSPSLKSCFLNFALHPKSVSLCDSDIIGMWIAEGFVHGSSHDLEDIGREYYDELIQRNLIEPDIRFLDQDICHMHDIVRMFAENISRDESLVVRRETDITSVSSKKLIRLSLQLDGFEWHHLQSQAALRTLISVGHIKIIPGDSLLVFSNLRILHFDGGSFHSLVHSLHHLRHLRYLSIRNTDVSMLPEDIGNMKFLEHIDIEGCENLVTLPSSITKLPHLRFLRVLDTSISNIPRGFNGLTNLRNLLGFPAHMDSEWCSLEELGTLSQLTDLIITGVENVSSSTYALKARLTEKVHLSYLCLRCTSKLGDDGRLLEHGECISENEQRQTEEVFDSLCPPPCLTILAIDGYFGRQLPRYMTSIAAVSFGRLRVLMMNDLACCTDIPDGLCQLPSLEFIQIVMAPAIKRLGHEFMGGNGSQLVPSFPRLRKLSFLGLMEWEEWEWEEKVQAMPILEVLVLQMCKLRRIPPGLSFHSRDLRELYVTNVEKLSSIENLSSIVVLHVKECFDLERIINLPKLQNLIITRCPKMKVLKGVPGLQRLELEDHGMLTIPGYLANVRPRNVLIDCSLSLLTFIAKRVMNPEWNKLNHIQQVRAYAEDEGSPRKWYVLFVKDPFRFETNISQDAIAQGSSARRKLKFRASYQMCPFDDEPLVGQHMNAGERLPLCVRFRCNAYLRLVPWLHQACLHCNEALHIAFPLNQWTEAAVYPACAEIIRSAKGKQEQ